MNPSEPLPITRQCELLDLPRSTYYHVPQPVSEEDLELMRLIDRCHTELPFYGSRRIKDWLKDEGLIVNRKRVQRLMRTMGIFALYPKQKLSQPHPAHKVYPYLLRNLTIDHANQVWAADITYLPMARGFVYLVAIMDWHSRKVLSWRLSNTMDSSFCVDALNEAIDNYGVPAIFNTDQGSQFTSEDFTEVLKQHEIAISMDGSRRWMDNVFVERLWRSVKYEEVYLKGYEGMRDAKASLGRYFEFYNARRRLNHWTKEHRMTCTMNLLPGWPHELECHLAGCPRIGVHFLPSESRLYAGGFLDTFDTSGMG